MRKTKKCEGENSKVRNGIYYSMGILLALKILVVAVFLSGCTKDVIDMSMTSDAFSQAGLEENFPASFSESVEINPVVGVSFRSGTNPSKVAASSLTLRKGNTPVAGDMNISGTDILFSYGSDLTPMSQYTATLKTPVKNNAGEDEYVEYSWTFKTGKDRRKNSLSVVSVDPADQTKNVPVTASLVITTDQDVKSWMKSMISVVMKAGSSSVAGTLTLEGKTITFDPSGNLDPGKSYSCLFTYRSNSGNSGGSEDDDDDDDDGTEKSREPYSWSFTTAGSASTGSVDITPPTIGSVVPAMNAGSVAVTSVVMANFSEAMNSATINTSTFFVKQGSASVAGTVSYSGNVATFSPSATLAGNTVYTATVTTGVKDVTGNAMAVNYTWNFTTAAPAASDVTAPTVQSVAPASNATGIAVNSKVTATFSEAMNSATITTSTFTLKKGATSVSGTVSYSGSVATFSPSAALTGNTVYSATVTTGVKDAAGNAMTANYTWNFTTVAASTGMSFANDVIPVLGLCNNCHKHGWTTSTSASTYYTNLVNGGYVNPTTPTSSLMYIQLSGNHASSISSAEKNKILTWFTEGAKNN